jgi:transcriptional regulator with XRE-family HTH domain
MKFGTWIRAHRLRLNLSMDRVCQEVDLSKAYLSLIETGQKGPPKDPIVSQMAEALGLDEEDMLLRAHRERYPEDVIELRRLTAEVQKTLETVEESCRRAQTASGAKGKSGQHASDSPGPVDRAVKALSEAVKGIERLVPTDSENGSRWVNELEDLRAEEQEFILAMARQVKSLRPRRGPQ